MTHIGDLIRNNPLLAEEGRSINIVVVPAQDKVYEDLVQKVAIFNEFARLYHQSECRVSLIGFSDGATEVKNLSETLATAYREEKIAYVGMIDLARMKLGWTFPDVDSTVVMRDNILDGDNFFQHVYSPMAWFFPFDLNKVHGHQVVQANQSIRNNYYLDYDMETIIRTTSGGHLGMPRIREIQEAIAEGAAAAYVRQF